MISSKGEVWWEGLGWRGWRSWRGRRSWRGPSTLWKFLTLSRFLGRGCDEAFFSEEGLFSERGEAIEWMRGLVRISTGKAIQWRGPGHSVNRWTLKTEKLLSSSPSRKSPLIDLLGTDPYLLPYHHVVLIDLGGAGWKGTGELQFRKAARK